MALPLFGTLTSFDTLKSSNQTIAQFGEDRAWDGIASLLNIFNLQRNEIIKDMVDTTTSRLRRYGGAPRMRLQRTDEFGTPNVQKGKLPAPIGFPLEKYEIAVQYTRTYFKTKKAAEFAAQIEMVMTASMTAMIGNIKAAIFGATNFNFVDYLVDHLDYQFTLPIKALINADGQPIPPGPNGEFFDGTTHNHYLASAGMTNSWLASVVETVLEHTNVGNAIMWIARGDAATVSVLPDFKELVYTTTEKATVQEYGEGSLDPNKLNNRQIGWFRGAAVWVKPYMVSGYVFVYMANNGRQPLVMRVRGEDPDGGNAVEGAGDLQLVYQAESHPLRATGWEQEYGISVWNRTNAAVGYFGGVNYVIPNIQNFF